MLNRASITRGKAGRACAAVLLWSAMSCAPEPAPAGPMQGIHIAEYSVNVTTVRCGVTPSPDSIYWNVRMVNATADTAYVQFAGSYGTIVRSSNETLVGRSANMLTNLPFAPDPAVLMSQFGNLTIRVSMPTQQMCVTDPATSKDVYTSIRIAAGSAAAGYRDYVTAPHTLLIR